LKRRNGYEIRENEGKEKERKGKKKGKVYREAWE
jgi:hypothetical protein